MRRLRLLRVKFTKSIARVDIFTVRLRTRRCKSRLPIFRDYSDLRSITCDSCNDRSNAMAGFSALVCLVCLILEGMCLLRAVEHFIRRSRSTDAATSPRGHPPLANLARAERDTYIVRATQTRQAASGTALRVFGVSDPRWSVSRGSSFLASLVRGLPLWFRNDCAMSSILTSYRRFSAVSIISPRTVVPDMFAASSGCYVQ